MSGVTVLGGAGFIGSHLVDELMAQGHEVTVLDNLSEGKLDNLKRWKNNPKFDFCRGDITDYRQVEAAVDRREWVFHLAAMSRIQPSITDPMSAWKSNIMGTANVLEACRNRGVKRVVYSASSSAYGQRNTPPLNELMPTDCLNPYSLSKKVGEELMDQYRKMYGLSTVSLRYFNVYGPRHQEEGSYATVIAVFRKQKREGKKMTIVGDGTQRRDFTFVSDVVRANIMAAMNYETNGVFNVGTGENYSINQIAEIIQGESEFIPARLGEAQVTLADTSKIRTVLGWQPQVDLRTGLQIIEQYEKINSRSSLIILP